MNTESYLIWSATDITGVSIDKEIDSALGDYSCYPEFEWPNFNVRPPESLNLINSWRDRNGDCFVFLLAAAEEKSGNSALTLTITGLPEQLSKITPKIKRLKEINLKVQKKEINRINAKSSFESEAKQKSINKFSKLISALTLIINVFSVYLKETPPPTTIPGQLLIVYQHLVMFVHFTALILLILIILIYIIYTLKYGCKMLRGMK